MSGFIRAFQASASNSVRSRPLLLVGASVRAAAYSALRAGFTPWGIDLFTDRDLVAVAPSLRVLQTGYPQMLVEAASRTPLCPWLYTGGLENHPDVVRLLATARPLWGNDAAVLHRARDRSEMRRILGELGLPAVEELNHPPDGGVHDFPWLVKPRRGAGGAGIVRWEAGVALRDRPGGYYFQKLVAGTAMSAVFVGSGSMAQFLGATRQLVGEPWLGARPFQYCGNIGPISLPDPVLTGLCRFANAAVSAWNLCGLFGIDFISRDDLPWILEINPRYVASIEVLELAFGRALLADHIGCWDPQSALCAEYPDRRAEAAFVGKAILYAREDLIFPPYGPWERDLEARRSLWDIPMFADIPRPGEPIAACDPVLTTFVGASSQESCEAKLRDLAECTFRWITNTS
jgi:predicted ATP-grasp superfamily ATP-dependent carboligase